jgi:hypothetical protein
MVPDIKMNYQKGIFDDKTLPEVEVEENRNIDWKFMRKQMIKALLFPLVIVGIIK